MSVYPNAQTNGAYDSSMNISKIKSDIADLQDRTLATVITDETLTGDGSEDDPLAVAIPVEGYTGSVLVAGVGTLNIVDGLVATFTPAG